jgi:hypothetical protein
MSLANYPEDYENALAKIRNTKPVIRKQMLGLIGNGCDGSLIFIPGSYEKGYSDSLRRPGERPSYILNLGLIGKLSDGTWVFPPSYDAGLANGTNDLKFAILAEGEKRLMNQAQEFEAAQRQMRADIDQKICLMQAELTKLRQEPASSSGRSGV